MTAPQTKSFTATGIKLADDTSTHAGTFEAVFATLNVKDRDGDVITPGALINDGSEVLVMAQHRWSDAPIGKAIVQERGTELVAIGRFFTETTAGEQAYKTAKAVGDLQEWSFGFDIIEAGPGEYDGGQANYLRKLRTFEVSPVMLGAGINTRTTAIKEAAPTDPPAEPNLQDAPPTDPAADTSPAVWVACEESRARMLGVDI